MKICRFNDDRLGLVEGDTVIDVGSADPSLPTELGAVLAAGTLSTVGATAATAPRLALADVRLEAPIPLPTNFIAIGLNYADHAKEAGQPIPSEPIIFYKLANCLSGPNDDVMIPLAFQAVRSPTYNCEIQIDAIPSLT